VSNRWNQPVPHAIEHDAHQARQLPEQAHGVGHEETLERRDALDRAAAEFAREPQRRREWHDRDATPQGETPSVEGRQTKRSRETNQAFKAEKPGP
jgi:hypothetical protein